MRDEMTRRLLVQSKRWENLVKGFDVLAIAKAGVIDLSSLTDEEHSEIRSWTSGLQGSIPKVIEDYFNKIAS